MLESFERLSLTSSQYYTQLSTSQFSQRIQDTPPIKRLDSLLLTNFKSFRGTVYVGPLLDFTSIIGPNGAGKSNIMDALMFCLCNQRSKVSFYDLRQFIQRDGEETYAEMAQRGKACLVEARFIVEGGKQLTLRRVLHPSERQQFSIDGEEYSQRVYEHFLMRCNLNYLTSNYAIWQGEVDKLLLKTPKQLTAHLQDISGSAYFKEDQVKLKKELDEVDEVVQTETGRLVKLRLEKKNVRKMLSTKDSSTKTQEEYEKMMLKVLMARMHIAQREIQETEVEHEKVEREEQKRMKEINDSKLAMQREQSEKLQIQARMAVVMREVAHHATLIKTLSQTTSILDLQAKQQLETEINSLRRYTDNLRAKRGEIERDAAGLQSLEVDREYLQLFGRWEKENEVMTKELAKKKNEYVYGEELLRTKRAILAEFQQKAQRAEQLEQEEDRKRKEVQGHAEELAKTIARMKVENSKLSQEYINSKGRLEDRYAAREAISEKISELEGLLVENIENERDKELVQRLGGVEGFKGLLEQWIRPANKKYQLCFQIMLGGLLKHLLCTDEQSSKHIAARLRENGQLRTLIILSNVKERKGSVLSRADLGKNANLAIDSIEFEKGLKDLDLFMREYLSGKVICDNLQAAWALLGQNNVRGIKEIYTLDGSVLRHDGVLSSYGSVDIVRNKYKYVNGSKSRALIGEELQGLQKEMASIEQDIKALKEKVSDERINKHNLEVAKLEAKRQELLASLGQMKKGQRKDIKLPRGLQAEIEEQEKRVQAIRDSMKEIEKEMLGSKIFSDFLKKNKMNNLESFRSLEDLSSLQAKMKLKNKTAREFEQTERELAKVAATLSGKEQRLRKLAAQLDAAGKEEQRSLVARKLKAGEQELTAMRSRLAKMSNINVESLKFKSQLPQINSRLSLLKERYDSMVKAELAQLGLQEPPGKEEFKQLQEHLTTTLKRASREMVADALSELLKEAKKLESELEKHNMDLSSFAQDSRGAERIQQEIEAIENSLKQCGIKKADIAQKLEAVKQDRKNLFMRFFSTLRPILQRTYELLTENTDGVAGKVDLYLENEEFPCDDGVYFYPTPPTKRFVYDLDQLSGGEKSLASLALQYSIASASKSPFLMLDEIDAFLDAGNVQRFVKLVNHSIKEKALQFILVTHKRSLFLSGQSLVGVAKSQSNPFSRAYSLLLEEQPAEV